MQKMEKITLEKKGGTFTQIVTIYYINPSLSLSLSESLSPTIRFKNEIKIQNTRNEEHLPYTTLKHKNPSLKLKTASFWASAGVYIGIGDFQKMRRGDASKIDAWPHHIAADPRQYQGQKSLVLVRESVALLGFSWYIPILVISSEYSSDVCKSLDSTYLLNDPLLGLQVMRI